MKIAALARAMAVLGVSASLAVASPPPGKGKPAAVGTATTEDAAPTAKGKKPRTGEGCRPRVTVVLKGSLVEIGGSSLKLDVIQANAHGKTLVGTGLVVTVDQTTRFTRRGAKTAEALVAGDRLLVQARVCKADLGAEAAPPLVAARVVAHPPTA